MSKCALTTVRVIHRIKFSFSRPGFLYFRGLHSFRIERQPQKSTHLLTGPQLRQSTGEAFIDPAQRNKIRISKLLAYQCGRVFILNNPISQ